MMIVRLMKIIIFSLLREVPAEIFTSSLGGSGGYRFDDYPFWANSNYSRITVIDMQCGINEVGYIALRYGDIQGNKRGLGLSTTINLQDTLSGDEYLIGVDVWYSNVIHGMQFVTNMRYLSFCGDKNGKFASERETELLYISGSAGFQLDSITLHWYEDYDNCHDITCFDGGSCIDLESDFLCNCSSGYAGKQCEINIDECQSFPCQNDGICTDKVDGFVCNCTNGFYGSSCENEINECENVTCFNEGVCVDLPGAYQCDCLEGFTGEFCETDIDECQGSHLPCLNNGRCIDLQLNFLCNCSSGFTGTWCETELDECQSNPCMNGGVCVDDIDGYSCVCPEGYNGTECQNDTSDCESMVCYNGGTCRDLVNGYLCDCIPQYTGRLCETEIHGYCKEYIANHSSTSIMNIGDLERKLDELRKELQIAKKSLSSYLRRKISAADDRLSAKITGSVLGIVVLIVVGLTIILPDAAVLLKQIWKNN